MTVTYVDYTCVICGKALSRPPTHARMTCGDECKVELQRRNSTSVQRAKRIAPERA